MYPGVKIVLLGSKRVAFIGKCKDCQCHQRMMVSVEQFENHAKGAMMQEAFDTLSAGEREWLISGICGTCFDKMFSEETQEG